MNAPLCQTPSPRLVLLAQAIDRRHDQSALESALSVGRLVIHGIYGGNLAAWRLRGSGDLSFRKLARLTRVSSSVLYRSAAIYEMSCRMDVVQWGLPMSHLRAVVGLPHEEQRRLLTLARRKRWTVRRMESACAEIRQSMRARPVGRPRTPELVKGITRLDRALKQTDALSDTDLSILEPAERQKALEKLDRQLAQLTDLRSRLAAVTPGD